MIARVRDWWRRSLRAHVRVLWRRWAFRPWHCLTAGHIHFPDDGRGPRRVFIDGKEYKFCIWANLKTGRAVIYKDPLTVVGRGRRERLLRRTVHGKIEVLPDAQ